MSEGNSSDGIGLAQAEVEERRGFSVLWIIPVVAAVIAGGLAYRTLSQRGPLIEINFTDAEGIEVGKTEIRYRAVAFGVVESLDVADDLQSVVVGARVSRRSAKGMREGARFWVVRPRVGAGGISGLGTLISGSYIAFTAGPPDGAPTRRFKGLEEPPLDVGDPNALRIELVAERVGDVANGSPVYHRDIQVGRIVGHELNTDGHGITIHALIEAKHAKLVDTNSHFWNVSGIELDASFTGVNLSVESLQALLAGGVSFDTPGSPGTPAKSGARYSLYANEQASKKAWNRIRTHHFVLEAKGLGSLRPGEPVLYHGVQVGSILDVELKEDAAKIGVLIGIEPQYARLVRTKSVFWNASGITADLGLTGIHVHAASLASLMSGGVAFATPSEGSARAASGSVFSLHDEPQKHWLDWRPHIWIGSIKNKPKNWKSATEPAGDDKPELVHHDEAAAADPKSHHWWSHLFGKKD